MPMISGALPPTERIRPGRRRSASAFTCFPACSQVCVGQSAALSPLISTDHSCSTRRTLVLAGAFKFTSSRKRTSARRLPRLI